MLIVCTAGLFGNISAIVVFSKSKRSQKNFYVFMLYLALFDFLYLIVAILVFILPQWSMYYKNEGPWHYVVPWAIPIGQVCMTGGAYFTIVITIERYLTVCHPFYMVSRQLSAKPVSVGIIIFSILYNLPKFFEISTSYNLCHLNQTYNNNILTTMISSEPCEIEFIYGRNAESFSYEWMSNRNLSETHNLRNESMSLDQYAFLASYLRFDINYVRVYTVYSNLFINGVVPFALMIVLNILLLAELKKTGLVVPPDTLLQGNMNS